MTKIEDKKKYFFLLLLCLSPLLDFIQTNFHQLFFLSNFFFTNVVTSYVLISFFLVFILKISNKNKLIHIIIYFLSIYWLLQFYYDEIKNLFENKDIDGYISVSIIIVTSVLFTYLLITKKFFFNCIFLFLFLNILVKSPIMINYLFNKIFLNNDFISKEDNRNFSNVLKIKSNNYDKKIFYIILDEMPSFKYIEQELEIDTSGIKSFFQNEDVEFSNFSNSNYNRTYLTLSSIFNLNYLPTKKYYNKDNFYPNTFYKDKIDLPLINLLKDAKFNFYFAGNEWARCLPKIEIKCIDNFNTAFFSKFLNDYASATFFSKSLFGTFLSGPLNSYLQNDEYIDANDAIGKLTFSINNNLLKLEKRSFVFVHHLSPHTPYRSINCKILNGDNRNKYKKNYISSVKCNLKKIEEFTKLIKSRFPNAAIVFQGDHGHGSNVTNPADFTKNKIFERYSIFNAIYKSESCNESFKPNYGNINTIRLVLRCIGLNVNEIEEKKYVGFSDSQDLFGSIYEIKN